jgi:glyoxylase-like metal-dependent hydrolase (beta-lactamase superfamily II)
LRQLAEGLFQLAGRPRNAINVYLMGDVLVDAGTTSAAKRILREVSGRGVTAHALTHGHSDHFGSSKKVCEALGVPLWCGAGDVEAVETGKIPTVDHWLGRVIRRLPGPPGHPVERRLGEGDEVAGFRVLEVPGHSAGHVAYWRESDRTLVLGDVLFNLNLRSFRPGLNEPPRAFTPDPARNRESARRVAALEPALVCFGHGPPMRDTAGFVRFIEKLPR